ncbi:MAG: HD domain-containing phosphohydrolase [Gemmatimonadota bacterium]|nr:HD domain-containing phosphohydrolase [Gemmatimonadota bacterium]
MRPDRRDAPEGDAGRTVGRAIVVMPEGEPDRDRVIGVVEEIGFEPELHRDAGTALDEIEYDRPALVVHSFDLPDMDGATFHTAVQKRAGGRRIPTLAIMPAGLTPDQEFGAQTGIEEYLCRPFQEETLRSRLSGLLMDVGEGSEGSGGEREEAPAAEPRRKERAMEQTSAPAQRSEPARERSESVTSADARVRVIGLGEWGIRGAELLSDEGFVVRAVDVDPGIERARVDASRRHRIPLPGGATLDDYAEAARALARDEELGHAIATDSDCDLIVVTADLSMGAGALLATLLVRLERSAPDVGRLAVVRLPGVRSSPDERALALVSLNAVLRAPKCSIVLVTPPDGAIGFGADAEAPVKRLAWLWKLATGDRGEAMVPVRATALSKFLATPGFVGWREMELAREDCAADADAWHAKLAEATMAWQLEGFSWSESQSVLAFARTPEAWIDEGVRQHFERLVQAAWDEAAPCTLQQGLYVGEQPARVALVSAGMPYPDEVLALRDSVEKDRERLAEKRKAAESLIPLADDFLAEGTDVLVDDVAWERAESAPVVEEEAAPEPTPAVETEPEPEAEAELPEPEPEPEPEAELPEPETEGRPLPGAETEIRSRIEVGVEAEEVEVVEEAAAEPVGLPELEPGEPPAAYETAFSLAQRILSAEDPRAEADLGEIRYALYDLLEILREEPGSLLPEVFRPTLDDWFARHHVNVAVLAILAGDRLKGSLSEVIDVGTAAMLHDLGMVPTRETWDVEMKLPPKVFERAIRPHPEEGFETVQDVPGMTAPIARMILEEHERMDGTGYPEGLVGDAIDPGARILAVCDTLEALTHPRPHSDALEPGQALGRLQVLGEYTLDPEVVDALVEQLETMLSGTGQDVDVTG